MPAFALWFRGFVWGADSFAFWAVSCGQSQYAGMLSSPGWFVWFITNIIGCNLLVLCFFLFVLYFLALWGLFRLGKALFLHHAWLFPFLTASLTPLFFLEGLRFENDVFGWCLAFFGVGLFYFCFGRGFWRLSSIPLFFIACVSMFFACLLWFPSFLVCLLCVFCVVRDYKSANVVICIVLLVLLALFSGYLSHSVTQGIGNNAVSEEIPLVGLVFILHILHFWKKTPKPFFFYGTLILFLGILKAKYMFLATPFLIMGLIQKHQETGLHIPKLGIKNIPIIPLSFFLLIGWFVMIQFAYPTQTDIQEMKNAIQLSKDLNIPLYNDWGDGWTFVSLGFDTNYKISTPNPDYNKLKKPYIAYSKTQLDCKNITKKTQLCE